jgi:hypothetical protein
VGTASGVGERWGIDGLRRCGGGEKEEENGGGASGPVAKNGGRVGVRSLYGATRWKVRGPAGDRGSGRPAPTQERRVWAAHYVASKQGRGSNGVQIQFNLN